MVQPGDAPYRYRAEQVELATALYSIAGMYWMLRILVADDNGLMRDLMVRLFETLLPQAEILTAASGEEALSLADRPGSDIDLALLDYQMPGINGIDCAIRLRERHPAIDVRIITGEFLDPILQEAGALGIEVLSKPARRQDFEPLVEGFGDR